jgi:hypothetical protein
MTTKNSATVVKSSGRGYFRTTVKMLVIGQFWPRIEAFEVRSTRGYRRVVPITRV